MATTQQTAAERSTKLFNSATDRTSLINNLIGAGYNGSTLNNSSNDDLLALGEQLGSDAYQRNQRQRDRAESLSDFGAQLSALTASKQRQAEQAGRIASNNTRNQGLAQMMSNF